MATVGFIDNYCLLYRSVFADSRLYECFKYLQPFSLALATPKTLHPTPRLIKLWLIDLTTAVYVDSLSLLPRKTLPEIAKPDSKMGKAYITFYAMGCGGLNKSKPFGCI